MGGDRSIDLTFKCGDCGKKVHITNEGELFNLMETQMVAENEQLMCWKCAQK